jgi:hypothetical protein
MTTQKKKPTIQLDGVPDEEDVSKADAEQRLDLDPDEQVNLPEQKAEARPASGQDNDED